jgi:hypothetical protein
MFETVVICMSVAVAACFAGLGLAAYEFFLQCAVESAATPDPES